LNFAGLSQGYLGWAQFPRTLNADFLSMIWPENVEINSIDFNDVFYTQRIPRIGFFHELLDSETEFFRQSFCSRQRQIESMMVGIDEAKNISVKEKVNLVKLAIRMGVYSMIDSFKSLKFDSLESDDDFNLYLTVIVGRISRSVSEDAKVDFEDLFELSKRALVSPKLMGINKAYIFSTLVVSLARHGRVGETLRSRRDLYQRCGEYVFKFLTTYKPKDEREVILVSVMWRGIAMFQGLPSSEVNRCLTLSLEYATSVFATSGIMGIVIKENLITLYQTLSKNIGTQGSKCAKDYLLKMVKLDPLDSTAYSELALIDYKANNWMSAEKYFFAAISYGPPSLAMNLYFHGCCQVHLNNLDSAENSFLQSSKVDRFGLSPQLSLYNLYKKIGEIGKAKRILDHIRETDDLYSQLTELEKGDYFE
jgi:hypothetical protein